MMAGAAEGAGICRTFLSGCSTRGFLGIALLSLLGGQVVTAGGGSLTRSKSWVQAVCQGQADGRCRVSRRPEVATRAGTLMSLADGRRGRFGELRPAQGASDPSEVERHHREHQPCGIGGEDR